jgi:hypothetical protein
VRVSAFWYAGLRALAGRAQSLRSVQRAKAGRDECSSIPILSNQPDRRVAIWLLADSALAKILRALFLVIPFL